MSCFIVPTVEAIVVTVANKLTSKKEKKEVVELENTPKITFHDKVKWLQNMLWGGSALLAFEHVWHGELIAQFPFLTAAGTSSGLTDMLNEMSTVGAGMAVAVTAIWGLMLWGSNRIEKRGSMVQGKLK